MDDSQKPLARHVTVGKWNYVHRTFYTLTLYLVANRLFDGT